MRSCPDPLTPPVLHERETEGEGYREAEGKTCRALEEARRGSPLPASRLWLFLGALNGLISVAAGAYGRQGALEAAAGNVRHRRAIPDGARAGTVGRSLARIP